MTLLFLMTLNDTFEENAERIIIHQLYLLRTFLISLIRL
jgi:hypothetical protein